MIIGFVISVAYWFGAIWLWNQLHRNVPSDASQWERPLAFWSIAIPAAFAVFLPALFLDGSQGFFGTIDGAKTGGNWWAFAMFGIGGGWARATKRW